jgi:hypothetical protein
MAGTVRERSPGHWQLRVFVGRDPVTGKPKQLSRSYAADRREPGAGKRAAEKKLASLVAAVERGEDGGADRGKRPVRPRPSAGRVEVEPAG